MALEFAKDVRMEECSNSDVKNVIIWKSECEMVLKSTDYVLK